MMKFHCHATEFLRSVYLIYLNEYLPASQTLCHPKNNLNCPPFFFRNFNPICRLRVARKPVQLVPRDICTRLGCYLYSTRCSWIIMLAIACLKRKVLSLVLNVHTFVVNLSLGVPTILILRAKRLP